MISPHRRAGPVAALALLLSVSVPAAAAAQQPSLRAATFAASAASAADWVSTYHALRSFRVRETNPILRPIDHAPGQMVTLGAAMDAGAFTAWNLTVGRSHPKAAAAGLWAMTAFRTYLTIHNIRNARKAARR
jgi:hypothetical protein